MKLPKLSLAARLIVSIVDFAASTVYNFATTLTFLLARKKARAGTTIKTRRKLYLLVDQ